MIRRTRILATVGPASNNKAVIQALVKAGVNVFRLNFSHGSHSEHASMVATIREVEQECTYPIGILIDLQGPKLRIGKVQGGRVLLSEGEWLRLDLSPEPGTKQRLSLPHPEIFSALKKGTEVLIDDGKVRLQVIESAHDYAKVQVKTGGVVSDHKGVNVPGVALPISALTPKDLHDLDFGLNLGIDWVALSFVQRPEDLIEARNRIGKRAWLMAKIEKPAAIEHLEAIIAQADGLMIARGDLGVEVPPQRVPVLQQRIIHAARVAGKPVVVATQMLESMVHMPMPTRAEASDVATAVYSGADTVMLSAESAIGKYPVEAVSIMARIIEEVEADPSWWASLEAHQHETLPTVPDAICSALHKVAALLKPASTVAYTASGFSALRASRERPITPILALTPELATARRLSLVWGVWPRQFAEVLRTSESMIACATRSALQARLAKPKDTIIVIAGLPFGRSGSTNLLNIAQVGELN